MENLEAIAGRVGRVICSEDQYPETLLESAGLVSELTVAFEAAQQRELAAGDLPIELAPDSLLAEQAALEPAEPDPLPPEELERLMRELLEAEYA
jgi:hypothetical protein